MARATTKQQWGVGSVFGVEQTDHKYCIGQVLEIPLPNVISCAFYDIRLPKGLKQPKVELPFEKIISALATTRDKLDAGRWKIISSATPQLDRQFWPNEQFRDMQWVGAKTYGSRIVENFLEAYFGLAPWDRYADPEYFDKLLFFQHRKPLSLRFKHL